MDNKEVIKRDVENILFSHGFSANEFKIKVENGTNYDPNQIVDIQVWITVIRNSIQKKYGLYKTNWPQEFETDLENGYFNN